MNARRKALSRLGGLLRIVIYSDLEMTTITVRADTHSKSWRETVPDFIAATLKLRLPNEIANKRNRQQTGIRRSRDESQRAQRICTTINSTDEFRNVSVMLMCR